MTTPVLLELDASPRSHSQSGATLSPRACAAHASLDEASPTGLGVGRAAPASITNETAKRLRTVLILSHKGGGGATTAAVNLAAISAEAGRKVLLVDLDPSCGAFAAMGVARPRSDNPRLSRATDEDAKAGLPDVLSFQAALDLGDPEGFRESMDVSGLDDRADVSGRRTETTSDRSTDPAAVPQAVPSPIAGLDILQCDAETWSPPPRPSQAPGESFTTALGDYDLVVVDAAAPAVGAIREIVRGVDEVVVTLRAEPLALRTLPDLLIALRDGRDSRPFQFAGVIAMLPRREPPGGAADGTCRALLGAGTLLGVIPFDPHAAVASLDRLPVTRLDAGSPAAAAFRAVASKLAWTKATEPVAEDRSGVAAPTSEAARAQADGLQDGLQVVGVSVENQPPERIFAEAASELGPNDEAASGDERPGDERPGDAADSAPEGRSPAQLGWLVRFWRRVFGAEIDGRPRRR
ncbi:MAG TPA: AAA family ATPase [Pirellulales bacterium]